MFGFLVSGENRGPATLVLGSVLEDSVPRVTGGGRNSPRVGVAQPPDSSYVRAACHDMLGTWGAYENRSLR